MARRVTKTSFGAACNGRQAALYTLRAPSGATASVTNHGATLVRMCVPDAAGIMADVVLGFDDLAGYVEGRPYNPHFGCTVGRYANRIAKGRFAVATGAPSKTEYQLATNNGANHLHGGPNNYSKVAWDATVVDVPGCAPAVRFAYTSPDGEEGYPGELRVACTYTLVEDAAAGTVALRIALEAALSPHAPTACPVNLCNHSYFNLAGHGSGRDVLAHEVRIDADVYTPTDAGSIPTGELAPVAGTAFDFRVATAVGARLAEAAEAPGSGGGYDHNWVLNKPHGGQGARLTRAADVRDPASGRTLAVLTNTPSMQFYTANYIGAPHKPAPVTGKGGAVYRRHHGLCLETQFAPDSPNHEGEDGWPSCLLNPGEVYLHDVHYVFGVSAPAGGAK